MKIRLRHPVSTREALARRRKQRSQHQAALDALGIPPKSLLGAVVKLPDQGTDPEPWYCTLERYHEADLAFTWSRPARRGPDFRGRVDLHVVYDAVRDRRVIKDPPEPKERRRKRAEAEDQPAGHQQAEGQSEAA